jgi:hypothetical protein
MRLRRNQTITKQFLPAQTIEDLTRSLPEPYGCTLTWTSARSARGADRKRLKHGHKAHDAAVRRAEMGSGRDAS